MPTHHHVTLGGRPEPDLIGFGGGGDFSCPDLQYGSLPSHVGYFTQFTGVEGGGLKSRGVWAQPEGGAGGSPDSAGEGCTAGPMLSPDPPPGSASEPPFEAAVCPVWLGSWSAFIGVGGPPTTLTVTCPVQAPLSLPPWALGVAVPWRAAEVSL